jgi:hypothetical protein
MAGAFVFHLNNRIVGMMTTRNHRCCDKVSRGSKKEQEDREKTPNPALCGTMHRN